MRQCRVIIAPMPRKSKVSDSVLRIVAESNRPISSLEIQKLIPSVDRATIYRCLDSLKLSHTLRIVEIGDGVIRYELAKDHHHHLICYKCKKIKKVELPKDEEKHLENIQIRFQKKLNFSSLQHSLEFFGLCQKCQNVATVQK